LAVVIGDFSKIKITNMRGKLIIEKSIALEL
jgi:hypothetical protein